MSVIIWLPDERPKSWNVNTRIHWNKRNAEAQRVKELVYYAAIDQHDKWVCIPFVVPVSVIMTVYYTGRKMDASNMPLKFYEDGLVAVGILQDDGPEYVRDVAVRMREANGHPPGVKLVVVEWRADNIYDEELGDEL